MNHAYQLSSKALAEDEQKEPHRDACYVQWNTARAQGVEIRRGDDGGKGGITSRIVQCDIKCLLYRFHSDGDIASEGRHVSLPSCSACKKRDVRRTLGGSSRPSHTELGTIYFLGDNHEWQLRRRITRRSSRASSTSM